MRTQRECLEISVERGTQFHRTDDGGRILHWSTRGNFADLYVENNSDPQESSNAELTPAELRQLAQELLQVADEIEARPT